jgi:DNA-binding NtrC family response regulator
MKEVWIVDDDDEMARAVELNVEIARYETKHFFNHPRPAAQALLAGKLPN